MSNLLLKFKRNAKDNSPGSRGNPLKSPLTHSLMASPKKSAPQQHPAIDEENESLDGACATKPLTEPSGDELSSPGSPQITIHASTTPQPKYYTNRPPPLDIPQRKSSLTVAADTFIPTSRSLDDLSSRTSGSSIDSDGISPIHRPSSPLLSALREAVDSVSIMEDFRIIDKIGAGFFAEVFKVEHLGTQQIMVVKINHRNTSNQTKREVEVLKKLYHPNLLHYLGACIHNGKLHPLTELVNGGTLDSLIMDMTHPFPPSLRLQLAHDLAKGMEYLHSNGILHRDLNSHNALLRKNGSRYTAVVADFGLASKNPHNMAKVLRRNQSVVGTPYWMAPEVLGGKPYGDRADVFSYGIILCEMIARREADPDELHRLKDFSLNAKAFRELEEVKSALCPPLFVDLACECSMFLPIQRPDFIDIRLTLDQLRAHRGEGSKVRAESLPPTPQKRLSWHYSLSPPTSVNELIT